MTTGEIIIQARKDWNWSQARLAKEIGISRQALSRIETGDSLNMTARTAVELSRALAISLDYLLCPNS